MVHTYDLVLGKEKLEEQKFKVILGYLSSFLKFKKKKKERKPPNLYGHFC